jgi:hypothetical protein
MTYGVPLQRPGVAERCLCSASADERALLRTRRYVLVVAELGRSRPADIRLRHSQRAEITHPYTERVVAAA